jgi:putative ABC transport system substrate-binding protein
VLGGRQGAAGPRWPYLKLISPAVLRQTEGKRKLAKFPAAAGDFLRMEVIMAGLGRFGRLDLTAGGGIARRAFLSLGTGAAVSCWRPARAQQPMPLVGFLNTRSPAESAHDIAAFRKGLAESGYVEGRNVAVEYRWAEGRFERLPALAAELAGAGPAVIAATGGEPSGLAARAAASTTPIVFAIGGDPVEAGFVAALNRPGGNLTGVTLLLTAMEGKRLGLLRELVPAAAVVAVLLNPAMSTFNTQLNDVMEAARNVGQEIRVLRVRNEVDIDAAFAGAAELKADALMVGTDPYMISRRDQMVALAARYRIPAIYPAREYAAAGGLMSYGPNISEAYRQVGVYVGRILKGARPAELPVMRASTFEFVINLKVAEALGLAVPGPLIARADEVIE